MTFLVAVFVASFAAVTAYVTLKPYFQQKIMDVSALHIEERANRQRTVFDDVRAIEFAAERSFTRRLAALDGVDISAEFDRLFPLYGDGTRRSAAALFEGHAEEDGDYTYGMGAFIPALDELTIERQRLLIAAYHTVRQHGEAINPRIDNLYFFTRQNDLIIFGPQRDDRLEFYRMNAPADFDFQTEMLAQVVEPENNPTGVTACTTLSRLIYVNDGSALTTGCHTPIRTGGRHLGAFGVTISLQNYLANAIVDVEPNSENMILTRNGELIAHRDLLMLDELTPDAVASAGLSSNVNELGRAIRTDGRATGVTMTSDGRILAFARIDTPGWYFVITRPAWLIHYRASQVSALVFLFSFFGVFTQAIILAVLRWNKRRRRPSTGPVGQLANA